MPSSESLVNGPMTIPALHEELENTRQQLILAASALREDLAESLEWREWVRRRPGIFLGGAFLLGLLIGARHSPD